MMVTRFAREMLLREGLLREFQPEGLTLHCSQWVSAKLTIQRKLTIQQSWFSAQLAKLTIIALRLK